LCVFFFVTTAAADRGVFVAVSGMPGFNFADYMFRVNDNDDNDNNGNKDADNDSEDSEDTKNDGNDDNDKDDDETNSVRCAAAAALTARLLSHSYCLLRHDAASALRIDVSALPAYYSLIGAAAATAARGVRAASK
jgi:hypothetical protein